MDGTNGSNIPKGVAFSREKPRQLKLAKTGTKFKKIPAKVKLVIVLLVVLGVALLVFQRSYSQRKARNDQARAYQTAVSKVSDLRKKRNQDDLAVSVVQDFLAKHSKKADKTQLAWADGELAAIYRTKGNYASSKEWQEKALANTPNPSFSSYLNLAEICELLHDKACATKYYQQAMTALAQRKDILGAQAYQNAIQNKLKALQ